MSRDGNGEGDYRVTIKVRNDHILRAIEAAGGKPGEKWCEENGLSYSGVNKFIQLKESPLDSRGNLRKGARDLCDVLDVLPDDLWSAEQIRPLERNFTELSMSHEQVAALQHQQEAQAPEGSLLESERASLLVKAMQERLTTRQSVVLMHRFGLDDGHPKTLRYIADRIGLTSTERVRQIEDKALRRLRLGCKANPDHPLYSVLGA